MPHIYTIEEGDELGFDVIYLTVDRYCALLKTMQPTQREGESKQAFAKRQEYGRGMQDTFAEILELLIADARIFRYGTRIKKMPVPAEFEIMSDLLPAVAQAWLDGVATPGSDVEVASGMEAVTTILNAYIFPTELEAGFETLRRKAILDGEETPDPGDREWLMLEAEKLENSATNIRAMVQ